MPKTPPHPHFQQREVDRLQDVIRHLETKLQHSKQLCEWQRRVADTNNELHMEARRTIIAILTGNLTTEALKVISQVMGEDFEPPSAQGHEEGKDT